MMLMSENTHSKNFNQAVTSVLRIIDDSHLGSDGKRTDVVKLHFLASLQVLIQQNFLNDKGEALNFAGLLTHLHFYEPSNFLLVHLLAKRFFHRFINDDRELLTVLCYLFETIRLPKKINDEQQEIIHDLPSVVHLPSLPDQFQKEFEEYSKILTDTIVGYFLAISQAMDYETSLPLSKISFPQSSSFGLENAEESFKENLSYFPLSSPFCVHAFAEGTSPAKLIHTSPMKLMLDWSHFPVTPQISNLNAYILDFYKHRDITSLSKANMIRESVARKNLISFHRTLRKISNALEILSPENDEVARMFSQLSRSF